MSPDPFDLSHCLFVNVLQVVMTSLGAVKKPVERSFQEQVRLHKTSNLDPLYNVQAAGKQFCAGYSARILCKLTDVEFWIRVSRGGE